MRQPGYLPTTSDATPIYSRTTTRNQGRRGSSLSAACCWLGFSKLAHVTRTEALNVRTLFTTSWRLSATT